MHLAEFDTTQPESARAVLEPCVNSPSWVEAIVLGRPYESVDALTRAAAAATSSWTVADLDAALAEHPRIGERPAGPTVTFSAGEQAQLGAADPQIDAQIAAGNREYEQRFGRVFLIRAAGRTKPEVLEHLHRRLGLAPEVEVLEAIDELRQITLLRLSQVVRP